MKKCIFILLLMIESDAYCLIVWWCYKGSNHDTHNDGCDEEMYCTFELHAHNFIPVNDVMMLMTMMTMMIMIMIIMIMLMMMMILMKKRNTCGRIVVG